MRFALQNDVINKKITLKDHYRKFIDLQKIFSSTFPQIIYHPKPNLRFMCECIIIIKKKEVNVASFEGAN